MIEYDRSHPSKDKLAEFLANVDQLDAQDPVSVHVEQCLLCQKELGDLLCSDSDIFNALRNESGHVDRPTWLGHRNSQQDETEFNSPLEKKPKSPPLANQSLRYELNEVVARGGMGIIYRANDKILNREVAIKIVADPNIDIGRFKREAKISGQLQHPGIVPIYGYGNLQSGEPFIAMKLVQGQTLCDVFNKGKISKPRQIDIFTQICQTVAYAHSQNVVHRDLKPSNIMIGVYGEVLVMDWGLAKELDEPGANKNNEKESKTDTKRMKVDTARIKIDRAQIIGNHETKFGTIIGTPAYMPYEQAIGDPIGLPADVFALGGILCEMLTGKPPFVETESKRNASIAARFKKADNQLTMTLQRLNDCDRDPQLIQLAKECLAHQPKDRPKDASIISARLNDYLESRDRLLKEAEHAKVRTAARLQAETKRRKQVSRLAALIATILIATTAATALYLNERNSRQVEKFASEKAAIEKRVNLESRIRSIISKAESQSKLAQNSQGSDRREFWETASIEIQRALDIAETDVDAALLKDLDQLKQRIEFGLNDAIKTEQQLQEEKRIVDAIQRAIKQSAYPKDMEAFNRRLLVSSNPKIVESLENAYANFGLKIESDIAPAVEKIRNSPNRDQLMAGVRIWRNQHTNVSLLNGQRPKVKWFIELLNAIDDDEFRNEVRRLLVTKDASAVDRIVNDPRALDSVLTVHTVFDYLNTVRQKDPLIDFLERARPRFPNDFAINGSMASFYKHFYPRQPAIAIRYQLACHSLQPDNPGVLIELTSMFLRAKDFDSAILYGDRMIEIAPHLPHGYNNVGVAYGSKGDHERAIEYLERALDIAPEFATTYNNYSVELSRLNRHQEAIAAQRKAIEIHPQDAQRHVLLCKHLIQAKDHQAAETAVRRALELQPGNLSGLQNLIYLLRLKGEFEEAIEVHKRQIKFHRNKTDTWANYAETLYAAKRYEEAEEIIQGPFSRHFQPLYANVLARSQWAQNKKDEAIKTLELQLSKRPNSRNEKRLLEKYRESM